MKVILTVSNLTALVFLVTACQADKGPGSSVGSGKSASLRVMEQVAIAAHKCWIASKDPVFRNYSMANELNNFGGTPRFLLVPKANYGGKPLLVVQARGQSSDVEVFGPIMGDAVASRISGDIGRWKTGDASCSPSA